MTDEELENLYRLVGERIRAVREASGRSQTKVAAAIGMSRVSLVNIEKGRQRPPLHVLWKLAEALDIEPSQLIPRRVEHVDAITSEGLAQSDLAKIDAATDGDLKAKSRLSHFISKAKKDKDRT